MCVRETDRQRGGAGKGRETDRQTERWGREGEREKTNVKGVCNSYNDAARSSGGRLSVGKTAEREFEVGFSTFQFHYLKHHLISTSVSLTSKWST